MALRYELYNRQRSKCTHWGGVSDCALGSRSKCTIQLRRPRDAPPPVESAGTAMSAPELDIRALLAAQNTETERRFTLLEDRLNAEIKGRREEVAAATAREAGLLQQLGQVQQELEGVREELEGVREELEGVRGELGAERVRNNRLPARLRKTENRVGTLEGEVKSEKKRAGQLEGELLAARARCAFLETELKDLRVWPTDSVWGLTRHREADNPESSPVCTTDGQ